MTLPSQLLPQALGWEEEGLHLTLIGETTKLKHSQMISIMSKELKMHNILHYLELLKQLESPKTTVLYSIQRHITTYPMSSKISNDSNIAIFIKEQLLLKLLSCKQTEIILCQFKECLPQEHRDSIPLM